jgi:3-phosphoshikimate 1-carboxyvinyltransferase
MTVPGSKSETQRALVLASLAPGESMLEHPLDCEDSRALRQALRSLGVCVQEQRDCWLVRGGPLSAPEAAIDCRDGGTTARFLGPLCLLFDGRMVLDGGAQLRERPIAEMVEALGRLEVDARYLGAPGALPVSLTRRAPLTSPRARVGSARSSQFASGLLLVGPLLPHGLTLELEGPAVSRPYLELTVRMMRMFGAEICASKGSYRVAPRPYHPAALRVGGDWSSAAFMLAGAFITGRRISLQGLDHDSAQADYAIVGLLAELGRPGPHLFDLSDCPDLLAPVAVAAAFGSGPVEIRGIDHARLKESDRPAVLARELGRAGVLISEREYGLHVGPGGVLRPARLDPRGDHRMAMAFGLLSLREPRIESLCPDCVAKSYPGFWSELERLR